MKRRMMGKIAVLATGLALALSLPVAGAIAEPGGVPHPGSKGKGKHEKQHTNKGKHKGQQKQNGPNGECPSQSNGQGVQDIPSQAQWDSGQGLKCGFVFGGLRT